MKVAKAMLGPTDRPPEFAIPRVPRAELHRMMAEKLAKDVTADRFAGSIMVQRHGKLIYQSASGYADRAAKTPVTMDTKFRIGSANKMFTAIGVLQLVEKGTAAPSYGRGSGGRGKSQRQLLEHQALPVALALRSAGSLNDRLARSGRTNVRFPPIADVPQTASFSGSPPGAEQTSGK
jgi:CubicO group peptidase (beta-lactamase class C family)